MHWGSDWLGSRSRDPLATKGMGPALPESMDWYEGEGGLILLEQDGGVGDGGEASGRGYLQRANILLL